MKPTRTIASTSLLAMATAVLADTQTVTYHYDAAGRLAAAAYEIEGTNSAIHYAYDANGNRTNLVTVAPDDTAFDSDGNAMSDLREIQYFGHLNVDGSADVDGDGLSTSNEFALGANPLAADTDGDGLSDGDEVVAGTSLTDPGDVFTIEGVDAASGPAGHVLQWVSAADRVYHVDLSTNLPGGTWLPIASNLPADPPRNTWTDTVERVEQGLFYRITVEQP